MFAEPGSSIWAAVNSWFTPTIFFVVLNLMIGTIYITSSLASPAAAHDNGGGDEQQHRPRPHPQLVRSPSMLQRLKSINFQTHRSQEPTTVFANPHPHSPDFTTHFATNFHDPQFQQPDVADQPPSPSRPLFTRSPSMLQRLKSINLYNYTSPEPTSPQAEPADTVNTPVFPPVETETHFEEQAKQPEPSVEEVHSHVSRTKSDTKPASGELPPKLPRKMRKSASVKSAFSHFEEEEIVEARRPATVREAKVTPAMDADEEVDAKADDFINKFKQQLKLQRMNSIIRYKEMIGRGSGDK